MIVDALLDANDHKSTMAAAAMCVQFDLYARPNTLLSLDAGNIFPPARGVTPRRWAVCFFPSNEAAVSKSRTQDDTVAVRSQFSPHAAAIQKIVVALRIRAFKKGAHAKVFPLRLDEYCKIVKAASIKVGTPTITPHMLRHGGASRGAHAGATMSYIQHRGQWQKRKSCLRYAKHRRYLRRLSTLPTNIVTKANLLGATILQRLANAIPKVPPMPTSSSTTTSSSSDSMGSDSD